MDASPLAGWENFYVIIGSSAGGLTGLTFVVIALIRDATRVQPTGLHAFVTPTIVHFGAALALAAYLSMPHQSVPTLSAGVGLVGLGGLSYGGLVAARLRRQGSRYVPVRADWIWNAILATSAYGALTAYAVVMWHRPHECLYVGVGLSALPLVMRIAKSGDVRVVIT